MDWNAAIENNREALKRILAALVAMAGMSLAPTIPRRLHSAVLRLLRPAEAAARRLVIVAARELVVTLPPPRPPKPGSMATALRTLGIAVVMSPADIARAAAAKRAAGARAARPRTLGLPLLDPPRRPFRPRRGTAPARAAPRIWTVGHTGRHVVLPPPPPSPDDPLDATRLGLRLQALGRVLDDLPGQARRFARWRARRDAAVARERNPRDAAAAQSMTANAQFRGRVRRIWPLKPGSPPGLPRRATRLRPSMKSTTSCASPTAWPSGPWSAATRHKPSAEEAPTP